MTNTDDILHRILAVSEGARQQSQHSLSLSGQAIALASALDQIEELIASAYESEDEENEEETSDGEAEQESFFETFLGGEAPDLSALFEGLRGGGFVVGGDIPTLTALLENLPDEEQIKGALRGVLPDEDDIDAAIRKVTGFFGGSTAK